MTTFSHDQGQILKLFYLLQIPIFHLINLIFTASSMDPSDLANVIGIVLLF